MALLPYNDKLHSWRVLNEMQRKIEKTAINTESLLRKLNMLAQIPTELSLKTSLTAQTGELDISALVI